MLLWEQAEADFEAYWAQFKKNAHVHRFTDTKEVKAKLMRGGIKQKTGALTKSQPSDYLITHEGAAFYAEVKSCSSKTSFAYNSMQPGQRKEAKKIEAAGGLYYLYIKSEHLKQWYVIRHCEFVKLMGNTRSVSWRKLSRFLTEL